MQEDYGINLPRNLQVEFRNDIQRITDEEGKELPSKRIHARFMERYVDQPGARFKFVDHHTYPDTAVKGQRILAAEITDKGETRRIEGKGTGPIDGFMNAMSIYLGVDLSVNDYSEHSLQHGSNAAAIAYVEMSTAKGKVWGAGVNTNIVGASLEAIMSAINRMLEDQAQA
jgi:2-isopropylmalate synthase